MNHHKTLFHSSVALCLLILSGVWGASDAIAKKTAARSGEKMTKTIEVQGHRGARARLPENTIPAFNYALSVGVDVLEMDLAVTQDKVLVISHDPHINPDICLDQDGKKLKEGPLIFKLPLSEVKKYDCGKLQNPRFPKQTPVPGTRIPTLDEVFEMVKSSKHPAARKVEFNIETKIFPDHPEYTTTPEEFTELVLAAFRKHKWMDRIVLQSFDPRTLVLAKKAEPTLRTSFLVEDPKIDLVEATQKFGAPIVSPDFHLLNADLVKKIHDAGIRVVPWTVNTEADWDTMVGQGVDGIISDDPEALLDYLRKKGLRK